MPKPLDEEIEFVKLRLWSSDLELLRVLHADGEGGVNGFVRGLVRAYCNRHRRVLEGMQARVDQS